MPQEQAQRIDGPDETTVERDESSEEMRMRDTKTKLLYKEKFGTVHVRIWGPTSGTRWKRIEYFRFKPSTRNAGEWDKLSCDREVDQPNLTQAVKAVRAWLKDQPNLLAGTNPYVQV